MGLLCFYSMAFSSIKSSKCVCCVHIQSLLSLSSTNYCYPAFCSFVYHPIPKTTSIPCGGERKKSTGKKVETKKSRRNCVGMITISFCLVSLDKTFNFQRGQINGPSLRTCVKAFFPINVFILGHEKVNRKNTSNSD